ncbi:MAG: PQQ-dependent sugar dehydrogenase [Bacteroidia bacterium]|nr:PQQ-dependent sugar dehydrogenase [Bacteroidia bacterium]
MKHQFNFTFLLMTILVLSCSETGQVDTGPVDPDPETQLAIVDFFPNLTVNDPVDIQHANDGTDGLYVVDQNGIITKLSTDPNLIPTTFLNLTDRVFKQGEMGLLGLTFHPDYESNGQFYVYYNPNDVTSRISRFTKEIVMDVGNPDSELILLSFPQEQTNHNGGQLTFGSDGYLYISSGDGGLRANGQDLSTVKGAILRIDVDNPANGLNYGIPVDNPFINDANARDEIYAYGLRNPWRMSFDRTTGDLWAGDVGSGRWEEINRIQIGGNYGWADIEGTDFCYNDPCDNPEFLPPFYEYPHIDNLNFAITGGYVYRGSLNPDLIGKYIYADYAQGDIWALDLSTGDNQLLFNTDLFIPAFGIDRNNELYFTTLGQTNRIFKFIQEEIP